MVFIFDRAGKVKLKSPLLESRGQVIKHAGLVIQRMDVQIPAGQPNCKIQSLALVARKPCKAVGPMYTRRAIHGHVKEPLAPKSRVLKPGVTGQIPQ